MLQRSAPLRALLRQRSVGDRVGGDGAAERAGGSCKRRPKVRRSFRSIPNRSVRRVAVAAGGVLSTAKLWSNGAAQPRMRTLRVGQTHLGRSLAMETQRRQLIDFLKGCRSPLSPSQLGLPDTNRRRTPGLRREDVAALAGVSVTWYTWLEQGRKIQGSADVPARVCSA